MASPPRLIIEDSCCQQPHWLSHTHTHTTLFLRFALVLPCYPLQLDTLPTTPGIHGKKIDRDYLRKKIWTGEKGHKGFKSLMEHARPSWKPENRESGRASPLDPVDSASHELLELEARARDEIAAERAKEARGAAEKASAEEGMDEALNGGKKRGAAKAGKEARQAQRRKVPKSRSPVAALTDLGMPSLVQKAWVHLNDWEVTFFADHRKPEVPEECLGEEWPVVGWYFDEGKHDYVKVDRHMVDKYHSMIEEDASATDVLDSHNQYIDWLKQQSPQVKSRLAVLALESGMTAAPGTEGQAQSEMGEAAGAMERAASKQADATKAAALARERASTNKTAAKMKMHDAEMTDKREERAARNTEEERRFTVMMAAIGANKASEAAAPPPPPNKPSSSSSSQPVWAPQSFDVATLLSGIAQFDEKLRFELLEKFNDEMIELADLEAAYKCDGYVGLDRLLQSISPKAGVRTKICTACLVTN